MEIQDFLKGEYLAFKCMTRLWLREKYKLLEDSALEKVGDPCRNCKFI